MLEPTEAIISMSLSANDVLSNLTITTSNGKSYGPIAASEDGTPSTLSGAVYGFFGADGFVDHLYTLIALGIWTDAASISSPPPPPPNTPVISPLEE